MRFLLIAAALLSLAYASLAQSGFRESQQRYPRVRQAYAEKWELLESMILEREIRRESLELYLVVYKYEKRLEAWGRNRGEQQFKLLKAYDICAVSGRLGPKRRQGDSQIPEGFYHINIFNPSSNFYLSLGLNYPNQSDRILSDREHPGGDIYIHGACVTIGCIPITDAMIKELYPLCVEARNNGQTRIPVTIYPAKMDPGNRGLLARARGETPDRSNLWEAMQQAYDLFQETHSFPSITFLSDGRHQVR
ncbi:MAG: L,D-transpeptidase family protein [Bacteroidota bacterium]